MTSIDSLQSGPQSEIRNWRENAAGVNDWQIISVTFKLAFRKPDFSRRASQYLNEEKIFKETTTTILIL